MPVGRYSYITEIVNWKKLEIEGWRAMDPIPTGRVVLGERLSKECAFLSSDFRLVGRGGREVQPPFMKPPAELGG